ncbi:MAG: DUF3570 domain-containing protein [Taibaiella sp.]|nr:DUF3570 domain-containing protein [Taibaiella sp.]
MKKLSLALLGCLFQIVSTYAQTTAIDSTAYKSRKLKVEEVNLVSGYYSQNGNNSAVTGGVGTEQLTDFANTLDVVLVNTDKKNRQYTWTAELGIDHYTSASSDKIDPSTISSASSHDTRTYPSLSMARKDNNGNTIGLAASFSTEFDYTSYGVVLNYAKTSRDNNREFSIHLQSYFDTWDVIYPIELRPPGGGYSGRGMDPHIYKPRDSYSASLSYSQVINKHLQVALLMDLIYQSGLLATDYQRVYFTDNSERIEALPSNRFKLPIGIRANYFVGDRFILRLYYRYYQDDWGIKAQTANIELPIKLNAFTSISPFYRFYTQNAAQYFAPYAMHNTGESYYTSDYDLSKFTSQFFGTGIRFSPENGILKIKHWSALEIRYGHYIRSTGLHSDIISLNATFK